MTSTIFIRRLAPHKTSTTTLPDPLHYPHIPPSLRPQFRTVNQGKVLSLNLNDPSFTEWQEPLIHQEYQFTHPEPNLDLSRLGPTGLEELAVFTHQELFLLYRSRESRDGREVVLTHEFLRLVHFEICAAWQELLGDVYGESVAAAYVHWTSVRHVWMVVQQQMPGTGLPFSFAWSRFGEQVERDDVKRLVEVLSILCPEGDLLAKIEQLEFRTLGLEVQGQKKIRQRCRRAKFVDDADLPIVYEGDVHVADIVETKLTGEGRARRLQGKCDIRGNCGHAYDPDLAW